MTDDPTLDKLTRFTPAAGSLDRDELLFRAGRASARPNRGWKAATAGLAASQAVMLAVWVAGPPQRSAPATEPVRAATRESKPVPVPQPPAPPPVSPGAEPSSYLVLSRDWGGEPPTRPAPAGPATGQGEPPLTARWRGDPVN